MRATSQQTVRLLSRADVRIALRMTECIDTIEAVFRQQGAGKAIDAAVIGAHVDGVAAVPAGDRAVRTGCLAGHEAVVAGRALPGKCASEGL